jgi:RHS repeat-associated protein
MNPISNHSARLWKFLSVAILTVLSGFQLQAADRHVCTDAALDFGQILRMRASIPDSVNCGGPGNTGPITVSTNYVVPGCRGCLFKLSMLFDGNLEVARIGTSTPTGYLSAPEYFFLGPEAAGSTVVNATFVWSDGVPDTNNPCGHFTSEFPDEFFVHGGDSIVLAYHAIDGLNHSSLSTWINSVSLEGIFDDAGVINFDSPSLPADGTSTTVAHVSNTNAFPLALLTWQIDGTNDEQTLGCTIDAAKGKITAGKVSGKITVRAYCTDMPDCWIEADLQIGCSTCAGCPGGDVDLGGSLRIRINAGNTAFGQSAGFFQIEREYPSSTLSTPSILKYYTGGLTTSDVSVIRSNGTVQSVFAPQLSANVVSNSPYQYQIILYTNSTLTGTPDTIWTFLNPDGASSSNRLTVTKSTGGLTAEFDYAWSASLNGWSLTSEGGAKVEKRFNSTNGVLRTETHLIYDGASNLLFQETNIYQTFPWREQQIQHILGGGTNRLITAWSFYTNAVDTTNYGRLFQVVSPGNNWERYAYDTRGALSRKVTQYLDAPIPTTTAQENTNRVMSSSYYMDTDGFPSQGTTNSLNGQQLSWTKLHFIGTETIEIKNQSSDPSYNSSYWLTNYTWTTITPPFVGEPAEVLNPDGTVTVYFYQLSADGNFKTTTVATGQTDSSQSFIINGTETISVNNKAGAQLSQQTYDIASGLLTSSLTVLALDTRSRPTQVQYLDGTTETTVYGCCGIDSFTDREGVTTTYNYDPYTKQVTDTTRLGITTHNDYDAAGNLLQTKRIGTDTTQIIQNVSTYDTAGRLTSSTPASNGSGLNQTTTYSEFFDGSNHRINTTTYPDGGTRVETQYQDGAMLSVGGTAVFPLQYSYSMSTNTSKYGEVTKMIKLGGQTNEWTSTYQDALGRSFLTVYSAASGTPSSQSIFNTVGQLAEQIDPDGVTALYQYNGKGTLAYSATDMNGNNAIDFATDRISGTVNDVTTDNGVTVSRSRSFVWNVNGSSVSNLVSTAETSADGLRSWNIAFNNGIGITNRSQTTFDPAHGYRITTSTASDGSTSISTYQFGRLISVTSRDANGAQLGQIVYGYDSHGRQNTLTDARNGTTISFFNNADQITATLSPSPDGVQSGQVITNYFDGVGRILRVALADSTSVTNVYYTNGLLQKTSGSRTYPVQYTYDTQGRMKTMTTWTNFAAAAGAAVTTWNYDGYRGFLTNKAYADGNGPIYTNTPGGRLSARIWKRTFKVHNSSFPLETDYVYNQAGDLSAVSYTDSSPGLSYVYDRLGRQTVITNGSIVCTLAYNDAGELLTESYSGGPLNGLSVTNAYDNLLRRTAVALASQSATLTQYGYDAASRLQTVSSGTSSATYTYLANSPLVSQITFASNGVTRMTTTKSYDNLNRLTAIQSAAGVSPVASFNYANNTANQRTSVTNTDNSYWVYQYDALGQVTSGKKYWADGTQVSGQQFTYNFDDIGNRKSTASGGDSSGSNLRSATYTNNALNQLVGRTVPGYLTVIGSANSNSTVTVNLQRANRYGNYFSDELVVTNTSAAIWQPFTNVAVLNNTTNQDILTTNQGSGLVTKTPEIFGYDADGNLTNDGRFTYSWDDENRLTNITSQSAIPTAAKYKLDMVYDYLGRRIQKVFSTNNGSAYVVSYTNKYVYDGWNLIAELGSANVLLRSYMWSKDPANSMQAAGSAGGLLSMSYYGLSTTNSFVVIDGNGNVAGLINAADGNIVAQYEYGPFGEVVRSTGPIAKINPFRFSATYQDDGTDLLYYGYRYYFPSVGRWQNRDPQVENAGLNLYGFVVNDPINGIDLLGQDSFTIVGKSFINSFGTSGNLGWSFGAPVPVPPPLSLLSVVPWFANARLAAFRQLATRLAAFNQNPSDASEDGQYRLFTRRTVNICFDGSKLNASVTDSAEDGGVELSLFDRGLVSGTINSSYKFEHNTGHSVQLVMRAWGHPHPSAEVGMQWVAIRTSVNIWHEARIIFSARNGKITYKVLSFDGSGYPSRRLWVNNGHYTGGAPDAQANQGPISDLWTADPSHRTFVAP